MKPTILIVDDEPVVVEVLSSMLKDRFETIAAYTGQEALSRITSFPVDLVLLDIRLPDGNGIDVLKKIKEYDAGLCVVMATATNSARLAVEAVQAGASDYVTKPFDVNEVLSIISRIIEKEHFIKEITYLRSRCGEAGFDDKMVGASRSMRQMHKAIGQLSRNDATVLISGESGTGKELIASAIHFNSLRKDKPFIPINCASIPDNMLESELFGHEKGAFTGASSQKLGMLELAHEGTVFLDEVSELRLDMQAKLLRALEEREIRRVGGTRLIKIDLRIISATNADLQAMVGEGRFRKDLFYRLNVIPVHLAPLRDRKEDIPLLIGHFLQMYNRSFRKSISGVTPEALRHMTAYSWPGNIREFKNIIERIVALKENGPIEPADLPLDLLVAGSFSGSACERGEFRQACHDFQRRYIENVLERASGNQVKAAKILGIHRNALFSKMKALGLK